MKKIIISGFLAGVVVLLAWIGFSMLTMKCFPLLVNQYNNTELYRSMNDPISMLFVFHPFILCLILSFVWDKTKTLFNSRKFLAKGCQYGLFYFLIVSPGLFISYITSPYSLEIVISWAISVLVTGLIAGLILEKLNP